MGEPVVQTPSPEYAGTRHKQARARRVCFLTRRVPARPSYSSAHSCASPQRPPSCYSLSSRTLSHANVQRVYNNNIMYIGGETEEKTLYEKKRRGYIRVITVLKIRNNTWSTLEPFYIYIYSQ